MRHRYFVLTERPDGTTAKATVESDNPAIQDAIDCIEKKSANPKGEKVVACVREDKLSEYKL